MSINETAEQIAFRFLADYHNGDEDLIAGWRRNADRRWCLTLQLCQSFIDEIDGMRAFMVRVAHDRIDHEARIVVGQSTR